jgi:hypothetical protein
MTVRLACDGAEVRSLIFSEKETSLLQRATE